MSDKNSNKTYAGRITGEAAQVVEAIFKNPVRKTSVVHKGGDIRTGK